jgi:hypothetical protein
LNYALVIEEFQKFYHGTSQKYDNKSGVFCEKSVEQLRHFIILGEENVLLSLLNDPPKEVAHKLSESPVGNSFLPILLEFFAKGFDSCRVSR